MIADYLKGSAITEFTEYDGKTHSFAEAWASHNAKQLARMNGSEPMDSQCDINGIQSYGGIPDELRRGSSDCDWKYIDTDDESYTYTHVQIMSLIAHAELAMRRGSSAFWDNVAGTGMGSIKKAIEFVIINPTRPWPWKPNHMAPWKSPTATIATRTCAPNSTATRCPRA